jgi:hypothetical protein
MIVIVVVIVVDAYIRSESRHSSKFQFLTFNLFRYFSVRSDFEPTLLLLDEQVSQFPEYGSDLCVSHNLLSTAMFILLATTTGTRVVSAHAGRPSLQLLRRGRYRHLAVVRFLRIVHCLEHSLLPLGRVDFATSAIHHSAFRLMIGAASVVADCTALPSIGTNTAHA